MVDGGEPGEFSSLRGREKQHFCSFDSHLSEDGFCTTKSRPKLMNFKGIDADHHQHKEISFKFFSYQPSLVKFRG